MITLPKLPLPKITLSEASAQMKILMATGLKLLRTLSFKDRVVYALSGIFVLCGVLILLVPAAQALGFWGNMGLPAPAFEKPLPGVPARTAITNGEVLYARPLFSPDRRPSAPQAQSTVAPASAKPLQLTLVGVMIGSGKKLAILRKTSGGETLLLPQGEAVDGWVLQEVRNESVVLSANGAQQELRLPEKERETK